MYHVLSWQLSAVTLRNFRIVSRRTNIGRPRFRYYTTYINETRESQTINARVELDYLAEIYIFYKYAKICSTCRTLLEIKSRPKYNYYATAHFETQAPCHSREYVYREYYRAQRHGWYVDSNTCKLYIIDKCVAEFDTK